MSARVSVTSDVETWPVVWRVTAPAAGSYDHDFVFLETESEAEASKLFRRLRRQSFPVRIEQVKCGPLPDGYAPELARLREASQQNPGTTMREIPAAWSQGSAA